MQYEFVGSDKKAPPKAEDVPTRVNVGGREYEVDGDRCIEAPARYESDLVLHGFTPRRRPSVVVQPQKSTDQNAGGKTTVQKNP